MREFDDNLYKQENLMQKEAFELYYAMGSKRDLSKLIGKGEGKVDRTFRTVAEWSRRFGWVERAKQRDIEISKQLEKKTNMAIIDEKAKYRKIIQASIGNFVRDLQDGVVKVKNIADFERLVKLDLLLMGEADSIQKVESNTSLAISDEDKRAIAQYYKEIDAELDDIEEYEE